MNIYERRMNFLSNFSIEDLMNPITQESITERLEQIDGEEDLDTEPETEDAYEEYKREEVRVLNSK